MVLQILVREPRHQRPWAQVSSGGIAVSPQQQRYPSGSGIGNSNNHNDSSSITISSSNRRAAVPLASPGGLPMAVIGAPTASAPAALEAPERYSQIVAVWQADCLLCGLSPFDDDTILLLGCPVDEEEEEEEEDGEEEQEEEDEEGDGKEGREGAEGQRSGWGGVRGVFQPEVQLVKRGNGEVKGGG